MPSGTPALEEIPKIMPEAIPSLPIVGVVEYRTTHIAGCFTLGQDRKSVV